MTIESKRDGAHLELALEGRLDTVSAPELDSEFKKYDLNEIEKITLDCGKLEYVSSAGLRVLVIAYRGMKQGGVMTIKNANEIVKKVFVVTGLEKILTVE